MDVDLKATEHACSMVRSQMQEEFPDLDLHFIICNQGELEAALERKRGEIEVHPAGNAVLQELVKADPNASTCVIGWARERRFFSSLSRQKTLACIIVFLDKNFSDSDRLRQRVYAMAWHVLNIENNKQTKKKPGTCITVSYPDEESLTWHNMLADVFSALALEMQGRKGAIRMLGKRRCMMALETNRGYMAEHYPYPVVMDAALLVFEDAVKDETLSKEKPFARALEMTREIGETFDPASIVQWWAFAQPAQEMAWLNIEKNKILGASAHTSENPYARSISYMVSEMLSIEPATLVGTSFFNAFTDMEANERHHRKQCEANFEYLTSAMHKDKADSLRTGAARQNKALVKGQIIGWCAPELLAAAEAYENAGEARTTALDIAHTVFVNENIKIVSDKIRKLATAVIAVRRFVDNPGPEHLAAILREDKDMRMLANALLIHPVTGK